MPRRRRLIEETREEAVIGNVEEEKKEVSGAELPEETRSSLQSSQAAAQFQAPSARKRPEPRNTQQEVRTSLRRSVHVNSQLVGRLSQEEQLTTCSICLETVPKAKETRLNDCPHTYCFDCIKKWVKEVENTCPQCKKPISQLKRADGEGVLTIEAVSHRRQNEIIGSCLVCEQSLNIADVIIRRHRGNENRVRDNQNISTVCEVCLTFAIHVRCMHG